MTKYRRRFIWLVIALLAAGGVAAYFTYFSPTLQQQAQQGRGNGRGRNFRMEGPVPVLATVAKRADVPVYLDGVGTTRALNTVTVRPQVDGKIISIGFQEGQDVKRGDVLAKIDPTTYQAQLDQAVAKKAQDEAQLANARIDLERYTRLAATNAGNKQQADAQRAQVEQLEAQVKLDQAAIDNARAYVDWATVRAPIDGRTGIRQIDEGNIVHAADATGIVVITQVKPISVLFNLPETQLGTVNKAFAQGPLPVDAVSSDTKAVIDHGQLKVIDNQVDQTTGTVKLKAEFPNADLQLWPGQFVNVRLLVDTLKQVVVVPTAAIQRGPNGTFVYVIGANDTASVRPVTVQQQDDQQTVLASGVEPPDQVVTSGFARLTDGSKVTVSSGQGGGPGQAPAPSGRQRRNGGQPEASRSEGGEGRRGRRSEARPTP